MSPGVFDAQFHSAQLSRLRALVELPDPVSINELESLGARKRIADTEILITSWGAPALTPPVLDAAPKLEVILHCAGSVRHLVDESVHRRGVALSTAADINAIPVAEYSLAAVIMAGKQIPFLSRNGSSSWRHIMSRVDLSNRRRRIGILGFSRTGKRVLDLLRVLDTGEVLVCDPYASAQEVSEKGARLTDLDGLLRHSEILTLHAPSLPETRHIIGAREFSLLPNGATIINTSRGALIDHEALTVECESGRLSAILDVTEPEPLPPDHPLRGLDNVMITPHIAGSVGSEVRRMSEFAIADLERWLQGEPLQGQVLPDAARTMA